MIDIKKIPKNKDVSRETYIHIYLIFNQVGVFSLMIGGNAGHIISRKI